MRKILDKIFFRSNNINYLSTKIRKLALNTSANEIFKAINSYSTQSEIRFVGGCIRKIINQEKVDDIDLATNIEPEKICKALKINNIDFYKSGVEHGTITAIINNNKFEITTLRRDIFTDGRHAKVEFSKDWKEDASRRDFTINSIYSDEYGNLFDPYDGKKDLEDGSIKFIGHAEKRIKEDYLRILRYLRFHLNYSTKPHKPEIVRQLKMYIDGISKLSKERLLDELKKFFKLNTLEKLSKDKISLDLFLIIFPELRNIKIFKNLNINSKNLLKEKDFIFLLSLALIDETDNVDYFLYKYNISKKNEKRIKNIDDFYKNKSSLNNLDIIKLNKIFYYKGKDALKDIVDFKNIKSKKQIKNLSELSQFFKDKIPPKMPVGADLLMTKYQIPEGKQLGIKLKKLEEAWIENNFKISEKQIENIVNS